MQKEILSKVLLSRYILVFYKSNYGKPDKSSLSFACIALSFSGLKNGTNMKLREQTNPFCLLWIFFPQKDY